MIQAGAFEGFPQSRTKIVLEAQLWNILTQREKRIAYNLGEKLEFDLIKIIKGLVDRKDEDGKVYIKGSRFETIKKKYTPYKEIYNQNSKSESLANWYYEKSLRSKRAGVREYQRSQLQKSRGESIIRLNY